CGGHAAAVRAPAWPAHSTCCKHFPMDRLERLKLRLKELPERPGVYLHKNAEGEVIYVGKARNLRGRVQSYLVGRGPRDARITTLIHEIDGIEIGRASCREG